MTNKTVTSITKSNQKRLDLAHILIQLGVRHSGLQKTRVIVKKLRERLGFLEFGRLPKKNTHQGEQQDKQHYTSEKFYQARRQSHPKLLRRQDERELPPYQGGN